MMIPPFSSKDNLMIADFILDKSEAGHKNTRETRKPANLRTGKREEETG